MNDTRRYTTNLGKAQGIIPETLELLALWEPAMSVAGLRARVRQGGALGRATQARMDDVVTCGFARRYLVNSGRPARLLKGLLASETHRGVLKQLMLVYTARAEAVLHDFISTVYWTKAGGHGAEVTKADARDFLLTALARGRTFSPWSQGTVDRVAGYLLGTLQDFEWIVENRYAHRQTRPPALLRATALALAHDLRFSGVGDQPLVHHPDWRLFGLRPADVFATLEQLAARGHLQLQSSGPLLRIEWVYPDLEDLIDAIADREV